MYITREELVKAYFDCRKSKRYTYQAFKFELDYPTLLEELYTELINDTYKPSNEIVFIIFDPKVREIFAAIFKDRIVHHLFINRVKQHYEKYFSDFSYNCRPKRGNIHACERLQEIMREDEWCLGIDVKSFFVSIDRKQTLSDLIKFIKLYVKQELTDSTIQLAKTILANSVTDRCKIVAPKHVWKKLPKEKSLFGKSTGYPIGDITSQFNGNFILTQIDDIITNKGFRFIRYADDLRILGNKEQLIKLKRYLFDVIQTYVHLEFHKDKVFLQPSVRGIPFVGYFVKKNYLLPGKRLKYRSKNAKCPENYFGFLQHCRAYRFMNSLKTIKPDLA